MPRVLVLVNGRSWLTRLVMRWRRLRPGDWTWLRVWRAAAFLYGTWVVAAILAMVFVRHKRVGDAVLLAFA